MVKFFIWAEANESAESATATKDVRIMSVMTCNETGVDGTDTAKTTGTGMINGSVATTARLEMLVRSMKKRQETKGISFSQ